MKLLVIMESFVSGGVERITLNLLKKLKKIDYEVTIYAINKHGVYLDQYNSEFDIISPKNIYLDKYILYKKLLTDNSFDIILATKGGLSLFSLLSKKTPFITVQHVPVYLPSANKFKNTCRKLLISYLYKKITKVISVSDGIKNDLIIKANIPQHKIIRIYNPVIFDNLIKTKPQSKKLNSDIIQFVAVGRCSYQKGYDLLLNIVKILLERGINNFNVNIIGDGELLLELKNKSIELNIQNNISFLGYIDEPYELLANSDCIILTSRWEGLPTVLVEAYFLDLQVISFDCDFGPRELTKNGINGFLIKNFDCESFANSMLNIINKKRKTSPQLDEFYSDYSANQYDLLFKSIVKKNEN
ncbi:glycosyltransferase [Moellerella wisconsensis]|uniref:glycosyltransferase n=1 Tax=Moellerella wisconsensis TaxID=158849 RepID=UPI003075F44B